MFSTLFADLSSNNTTFNAEEYRASGHVFVGIKATEGLGYVNPDHRSWSMHAHLFHIAVMHYHFARPDLNDAPNAEAEHFLRYAGPNTSGRDYLCVDVERATPQGWTSDPEWTQRFDSYIQAHSRFHTILYANRSTLQLSDRWLAGDRRRVWDADWSAGPDFAPAGYQCVARQFTDGVFGPEPHSLPGVGRCDVNDLRGTFARDVFHNAR